jgi:hypothetical protein
VTTVEGNPTRQPTGSLGDSIIGRVVRATTEAKNRAIPINRRVAETAFASITNHVSDEVRSVMGPIFREAAEHPDTPDEAKPLLRALADKRGQAWAWIGGTATGAALGGGLMNLLTNFMNPAILPLIAARPNGILSPSDAAEGEARSIAYSRPWAREAAYSGIDGERFAALVAMHRQSLTPEQMLTLLNRGRIAESTATALLRSQGYRPDVTDEILSLRSADLSPEILAQMWNRNIVSRDEGRTLARRSGVSARDFDRLTELGSEPPATQELLLAWRRGVIDEDDVDRALIQGPLRKEWIDVVKQLQWEPLSPNEAADSVNQGHMGEAAAAREARLSGVRPEHFKLMIENAGLPPGLEFAEEAFNRGFLTDDQWESMFKESRIKNRYIPLMRKMRTRLVPQETVRMLYREGVYSLDEAMAGLRAHGFSTRDASALLELEVARRTEGTRDLTRAQILDLFVEDMVEQPEAVAMLRGQGYSEEEANWQVGIARIDKMRRFVSTALTRIRGAYVGGHIDEGDAVSRMNELELPSAQIDRLLSIWDIERDTVVAQLTPTQIITAAKKSVIGWDEAYQRLIRRGYDPADAAILVNSNGGQAPTGGADGG